MGARVNGRRPSEMRAQPSSLRAEVLAHYGGQCALCGEDDAETLCFDHTQGGGSAQRRELAKQGLRLYQWLKKTGFPNDIRVLCWNCNEKARRESQRQISRETRMPPATNKKQIRLTVLEDRCAYLEGIAHERGCTTSEAFDQIVFEHQQLHLCLRSIEEGVDYLVSLHPPPTPSDAPAATPAAPYAYLDAPPTYVPPPPPRDLSPPRPRGFLRRIFG